MTNQPQNHQSTPIYFPFPTALVGPLPKNWERAFGYEGQQRWLAAYWSPYGDEAMMNDGMMSGTGNHVAYLDLERNRLPAAIKQAEMTMSLPIWALGSSDVCASHCLLCDLQKRLVFIAPLPPASHFMRQQYVLDESRKRSETELDRLWDAMEEEIKRQEKMAFIVCRHCVNGYKPTLEGYEPCPTCDNRGSWFVEVDEAHTLNTDQVYIVWPASKTKITPLQTG